MKITWTLYEDNGRDQEQGTIKRVSERLGDG